MKVNELCLENLLPATISEARMASPNVRSVLVIVLAVVLVAAGVYLIDPTFFGLMTKKDGFEGTMGSDANYMQTAGQQDMPGGMQKKQVKENENSAGGDSDDGDAFMGAVGQISGFADGSGNKPSGSASMAATKQKFQGNTSEGFADIEDVTGPAAFDSAAAPAGCYPRDQLTPAELLPKDPNSVWAQQNPMGSGSLKGKNFLSAGALIGVNTVGQSLRNANYQLRSEPPNPQVPVTVFNNSTIEPDTNRRDFEVA
jgi:hypothetical protein